MKIIATIGQAETSVQYTDRPTVKVIIRKDAQYLLLNQGLLPGGGIDPGESDYDALTRELQEELGATVKNVREIGTVIQYRTLLSKKYFIQGYVAELETVGGPTSPQDDGEAQFTMRWVSYEDAMSIIAQSIEAARVEPMDDDAAQGKLYNLMTTFELLKHLNIQ